MKIGELYYRETETGLQVRDLVTNEWRPASVLEQRYYWKYLTDSQEIREDRHKA